MVARRRVNLWIYLELHLTTHTMVRLVRIHLFAVLFMPSGLVAAASSDTSRIDSVQSIGGSGCSSNEVVLAMDIVCVRGIP